MIKLAVKYVAAANDQLRGKGALVALDMAHGIAMPFWRFLAVS